jgi:hypothetical protein
MKKFYIISAMLITLALTMEAGAVDLSKYKELCSDIGFKSSTEKHGSCVIKLYTRDKEKLKQANQRYEEGKSQRAREDSRDAQMRAFQERQLELDRQRVAAAQRLARQEEDAREEHERRRKAAAIGGFLRALGGQRTRRPSPSYGGTATGPAYLKRSYISGHNKVCVYNRMGSDYAVTIGAAQICPISQ